jgi:HD domain-containing protein
MRGDELARTDAERACLQALRDAAGDVDGPMERHCVRLFLIAERMGEDVDGELDREVLLCAALLHDAGLYPSVSTGDVYVSDGRRLAERALEPFGWEPGRLRRCLEAIELHHLRGAVWDRGAEVELTRRADLADVSRGLFRFGVPRDWLRSLFRSVPRRGLYRMLTREIARMARERPRTLTRIANPQRGR